MEELHKYTQTEYPSSEHAYYANWGIQQTVLYNQEKEILMVFSFPNTMNYFVEGEKDNFSFLIKDAKEVISKSGKKIESNGCFRNHKYIGKVNIPRDSLERLVTQGRMLKAFNNLSRENSESLKKLRIFE
ncbi:MAG: hypothetical protein NTZ83_05940 [Candidatus Pacearchaeota archaeon]|nr:hypothetical protein [Candidatus Pacearchaeota archaeon]